MPREADYDAIILHVFKAHYRKSKQRFLFLREEIAEAAKTLGVKRPKNLGDVVYTYRFRKQLPERVRKTAPAGKEWIIELAGRGKYRFSLSSASRIIPRSDLLATKIPDSTPEIIARYALNDEQALLARVRYNRLIDLFLGSPRIRFRTTCVRPCATSAR